MQTLTLPVLKQVEVLQLITIAIGDKNSETFARDHLTEVRLAARRLDADLKTLKAPHQIAIREIEDASRPWRTALAARDEAVEQALLVYAKQQREAATAQQVKALAQYERKVAAAESRASAKGSPIPLVLPPAMTSLPPRSVQQDTATQTTMSRRAWMVEQVAARTLDSETITAQANANLGLGIPLEYFLLDTSRISKVIRAGGTVAGIESYKVEYIAVKETKHALH